MSNTKAKKAPGGKRHREPVHVLFDLLGRRWSLRALWELRHGALGFRALREACGGASPTVLSSRLTELRDANLVSSDGGDYALTRNGQDLVATLQGSESLASNLYGV